MNLFQDIPILRRRLFRFALIPGAVVLGAAIVGYIRTDDTATLIAWALGAVLAAAWCAWYWRRLRHRARETVVRTRGLTCLRCGFSLVGLDENGHCPECGASYYADHVTRCWASAAGFP